MTMMVKSTSTYRGMHKDIFVVIHRVLLGRPWESWGKC